MQNTGAMKKEKGRIRMRIVLCEKVCSLIKFDYISFDDVLQKGLKVMDTTAFTLSQENKLPIIVFDMNKNGNLLKVVSGENIGTTVNL